MIHLKGGDGAMHELYHLPVKASRIIVKWFSAI